LVRELFFFDFDLNLVEQEFSGSGPILFPADIWETAFFFVLGVSFGRVFVVTLGGRTTLVFDALDKTFSSLIDDVLRAARDADFLATSGLERILLGFLGSSCNLDSRDREDVLDFVDFVDLVDLVDFVDWVRGDLALMGFFLGVVDGGFCGTIFPFGFLESKVDKALAGFFALAEAFEDGLGFTGSDF